MLRLDSIRSGYGLQQILQGVSLFIAPGESVALVGVNGAGKTTLVRTLMGFNRANSGRILKDDVDITPLPAHMRPSVGLAALLENRRLFGPMSIRDNLRIAQAEGNSRAAKRRFSWDDICDLFPLVRDRLHTPVGLLSGGQQQMVATARALLLQPDFLILDEPSTGLAPRIVKEIFTIFQRLRSTGLGILLVEQNVRIAIEATNRAYVMSLGKIVLEVGDEEWRKFDSDSRLADVYLGRSPRETNDGIA
ncbi:MULTISPECIES: ABC transporter ATP-binding protein [unclassified Bradyrhizobium]|uniref:ABC transporter ATP-binding protein n=1 Tax=unclassified Bradyrhizobium TaxID=2631580 RepID=UPI00247ADBFF|nr:MULTISPECIES: ABC transporter ATP-binding protein [unclassified Bradyrhizobium]WGR73132.1 ABC transporter ATP-binding protein [Bradyrhizobium sp. ISRA426]WGR77972.1 ABC transporter ATP-binding protein [Bradyrhizobium sp. ISRA430]WGR88373.1 ABC transporter ATP-binding protein [Bradyrhizobium sp. ISRA432]